MRMRQSNEHVWFTLHNVDMTAGMALLDWPYADYEYMPTQGSDCRFPHYS